MARGKEGMTDNDKETNVFNAWFNQGSTRRSTTVKLLKAMRLCMTYYNLSLSVLHDFSTEDFSFSHEA